MIRYLLTLTALITAHGLAAEVEPIPAPAAPTGPIIILTSDAIDGHGNVLSDLQIGVANGKITTLNAEDGETVIDLRGYTVLPGWIDTHVGIAFQHGRKIATEDEPPLEASLGIAPPHGTRCWRVSRQFRA